jgi:hypothetical protein
MSCGLDVEPEVAFAKNKKQKYMKRLFAVSLVMSLGAIVAQASMVSVTENIAPSSSGLSGLTFSLPTFNPTLGTLNSVELTLTPIPGDFGNSALNTTGFSGPATVVVVPANTLTELITGVGSLENSSLGMNATYQTTSGKLTTAPSLTLPASPLFAIVDGPALPFVWTTTPSSSAALAAAAYAALGGSLVFDTTAQTLSFTSGGGDGTWATGGYGNVGGNLEVDFSYTAVPEATTIIAGAMLLLPFGASTLRILRKNRTA